jgi:hypothetical protein
MLYKTPPDENPDWHGDRRRRFRALSLWHNDRELVVMVVVLIIIMLAMLTSAAMAHDPAHPELNDWYKSLVSKQGRQCCGDSDAIVADDWRTNDGHYQVSLNGQWLDVPDSAVVEGPNRAGRALVWMDGLWGGGPKIRCFMPGTMT